MQEYLYKAKNFDYKNHILYQIKHFLRLRLIEIHLTLTADHQLAIFDKSFLTLQR
jgi:hypothetical protein